MNTKTITITSLIALTQACTGYQTVRTPTTHAVSNQKPEQQWICDVTIDDFASVAVGEFPEGWETRDKSDLDAVRESGAYRITEIDGRRALHVKHGGGAVFTLGHGAPGWNLDTHPFVTWQWKVARMPDAADSIDEDLPASVQAVWLAGMPFFVRTLKYTWSAAIPVGTRAEARMGHDQVIVLRSGQAEKADADGWHTEHVNLREHYRTLFGQTDSQAPLGLSIQTGSDEDGRPAEAYYAGIKLCREPS